MYNTSIFYSKITFMKTKSIFIIACCVLAVIPLFSQINTSSKEKTIGLPAWLLRGNIGTNPAKNFIGTKDAQPLIFKVNNQRAGYLEYNDFSQTTAFGYQTLISNVPSDSDGNTGGIGNSAFGYLSLTSNKSGELNTALGQLALTANTEGDINTAIGAYSLFQNTTGAVNTAIGSFALFSNTEGSVNNAIGDYTLFGNTTGSFNVANGTPFTLTANTEGSENIATGAISMTNNSTGNANVAYGVFSLASNETGSNNTALGSHADVTAGNLHNATAIGHNALADASNKVRIGNNAVTSIGGKVGWTSFSDERIKDNIKENVPGLEFINALRPVTYHFNIAKENALLGVKNIDVKDITMPQLKGVRMPGNKGFEMPKDILNKAKDITDEDNEVEKIQFTGFLAQDVDKAAKSIDYDFSGIDKSGNIMGLRYSDFVVPLVKAVQELSKQNEDLQKQIDELRAMISGNTKTAVTLSDASLEQNMPNPFKETTAIRYFIPAGSKNAQLTITDNLGRTFKQVTLNTKERLVNVDATALSSGTYTYTLLVDGKLIESKKMVLAK